MVTDACGKGAEGVSSWLDWRAWLLLTFRIMSRSEEMPGGSSWTAMQTEESTSIYCENTSKAAGFHSSAIV
jgi:hypothetical protein